MFCVFFAMQGCVSARQDIQLRIFPFVSLGDCLLSVDRMPSIPRTRLMMLVMLQPQRPPQEEKPEPEQKQEPVYIILKCVSLCMCVCVCVCMCVQPLERAHDELCGDLSL